MGLRLSLESTPDNQTKRPSPSRSAILDWAPRFLFFNFFSKLGPTSRISSPMTFGSPHHHTYHHFSHLLHTPQLLNPLFNTYLNLHPALLILLKHPSQFILYQENRTIWNLKMIGEVSTWPNSSYSGQNTYPGTCQFCSLGKRHRLKPKRCR